MDGLISLLILIGIFSSLSKKKKKKAQKQAAQQQTPVSKPSKPAGQVKIPYTKEEWKAYLESLEQPKEPAPKPRPVKTVQAETPVKKTKSVLQLDHDEPEGTVSTQGESAAEHAEHRQKILAEEARIREQQETLQELRHMNRQKLRRAVVMSEVLGKPVSLRPRGYH